MGAKPAPGSVEEEIRQLADTIKQLPEGSVSAALSDLSSGEAKIKAEPVVLPKNFDLL